MSRKKDKTNPPDEAAEAPAQHTDEQAPAAETQAPAGDLQAERDDLLARLQRVSADFLNYKKRIQREIDEARQYANAGLIKSLLAVLDDMERAVQAASESGNEPLVQGMQMVHDKMLTTLAQAGLQPVECPAGRPFDPEVHAAMFQQPSGDHPPQTVLDEIQRGYRLHGRTIRPASVVVSREPDEPEAAEPPDERA